VFVTNTVRGEHRSVNCAAAYAGEMTQAGPVSRRERPAKAALSLETIIDTALALLDSDGLDKVSMRRVAQLLDTGPASLYVYVKNRDDLLSLMFDRVAAQVPLPTREPLESSADGQVTGRWREQLVTLIGDCIQTLGGHNDIASLGLGNVPTGPSALAITDAMLMLLARSGMSRQARAWAVDLIALYITASAVEQAISAGRNAVGQTEVELAATVAQTFGSVSADEYPHISDLGQELTIGSNEERQRWMIEVLLNGILATSVDL
jgi:AcrR family transcriptional regulator